MRPKNLTYDKGKQVICLKDQR